MNEEGSNKCRDTLLSNKAHSQLEKVRLTAEQMQSLDWHQTHIHKGNAKKRGSAAVQNLSCKLRIVAVRPPTRTAMIPNLFFYSGYNGNGHSHTISTPNTPNTVNILLRGGFLVIRKQHTWR